MNKRGPKVLTPGRTQNNKKLAIQFIVQHLNAEQADFRTVRTADWGFCHVGAYTASDGAMISTPNGADHNYGDAPWHKNDHIILFRDVGDGRCILYINKIEPLFGQRTIGHHGVPWNSVRKLSCHVDVLKSEDVLDRLK